MKKLNIIFKICLFLMFLGFIIFAYLENQEKKLDYVNLEVSGVVDRIEYFPSDRGAQSLMINNQWINMGVEGQKIRTYLKIGDSIIKKQGIREIRIYRKTKENLWHEKIFK